MQNIKQFTKKVKGNFTKGLTMSIDSKDSWEIPSLPCVQLKNQSTESTDVGRSQRRFSV